jgi:hypothetical protein
MGVSMARPGKASSGAIVLDRLCADHYEGSHASVLFSILVLPGLFNSATGSSRRAGHIGYSAASSLRDIPG